MRSDRQGSLQGKEGGKLQLVQAVSSPVLLRRVGESAAIAAAGAVSTRVVLGLLRLVWGKLRGSSGQRGAQNGRNGRLKVRAVLPEHNSGTPCGIRSGTGGQG